MPATPEFDEVREVSFEEAEREAEADAEAERELLFGYEEEGGSEGEAVVPLRETSYPRHRLTEEPTATTSKDNQAKAPAAINKGYIKPLGESAISQAEAVLRDACKPFVRNFLDGKYKDQHLGSRNRAQLEGLSTQGLSNTRKILDSLFGFSSEESPDEIIEKKTIEQLAWELNIGRYGVTAIIRSALNKIAELRPETEPTIQAYLDFLDENH